MKKIKDCVDYVELNNEKSEKIEEDDEDNSRLSIEVDKLFDERR